MIIESKESTRREFLREGLPFIIGDFGLILFGMGSIRLSLRRSQLENDTLRYNYYLSQRQNERDFDFTKAIQLHNRISEQREELGQDFKLMTL